ncbi:MAG TPA: membrane protein, partial [Roseiflexaceae bacterium]|nr:membrane protein [Roseiflexaceae bacterium]
MQRNRGYYLAGMWLVVATLSYLLLLGPAVGDAPVFTLPILLPWALWIATAVAALAAGAGRRIGFQQRHLPQVVLITCIIASLGWGATRLRGSSKHNLFLYRSFAEAALARLPPDAAVITHWEQGTTMLYLRFVEQRRPDVWIDVVEPGDDQWLTRAERRYPQRPVYFI